jgi:hypothetical protein
MQCEIAVEPQAGGGVRVTLVNCGFRNITTVLPPGDRVFRDENSRGLDAGPQGYLTVFRDGVLECKSKDTEFDTKLPAAVARDLFDAFANLPVGQPLEDAIEVGGEMDEEEENPAVNPNPEGGRRRSRVKKQTRRTQRKRRNTIRK